MKCICCTNKLLKTYNDNKIDIYQCYKCNTFQIFHLNDSSNLQKLDYYSNSYYLRDLVSISLRKTRERQSRIILSIISKYINKSSLIIDYGFGKGIFLRQAHLLGYKRLVGLESSDLMINDLSKLINVIKVSTDQKNLSFLYSDTKIKTDYKNSILIALDVIEHFKPDLFDLWFNKILNEFSYPNYLLFKVPSSKGILFNVSLILAKFKILSRPLYQLLQVDTFPPHYSYFSQNGLTQLISKYNYKLIEVVYDLDYEILFFGERLSIQGLTKLIINFTISPLIAFLSFIFNRKDSFILVFESNYNN